MPGASEALGQGSGIKAVLDAGVEQISARQTVAFTQYTKAVLSEDDYATDRVVDEDQTIGTNHVMLTSESEITEFNLVSPDSMWIGTWPLPDGAPALQIAFAQRGNYYKQADLWHYSGFAVYPALKVQLVASEEDLPAGPIVSNSLPIWLAQNALAPVYPSFLVPDNLAPPYVVAHVEPSGTVSLGAFPIVGPWPGTIVPDSGASPLELLASAQLMRDEVTLTLYGFSNQLAVQYLQSLIEASTDGSAPFGFANSPAISDAKRVQVEIASLAQKKTIHITANYYQGAADAIARRLILSAAVSNITASPYSS